MAKYKNSKINIKKGKIFLTVIYFCIFISKSHTFNCCRYTNNVKCLLQPKNCQRIKLICEAIELLIAFN